MKRKTHTGWRCRRGTPAAAGNSEEGKRRPKGDEPLLVRPAAHKH